MQVKKGEKKSTIHFFFPFFSTNNSEHSSRAVAGNKMVKSSVHVVLTSEWIKRDNKLVNKPRYNTARW